jgi:hypothetical protein
MDGDTSPEYFGYHLVYWGTEQLCLVRDFRLPLQCTFLVGFLALEGVCFLFVVCLFCVYFLFVFCLCLFPVCLLSICLFSVCFVFVFVSVSFLFVCFVFVFCLYVFLISETLFPYDTAGSEAVLSDSHVLDLCVCPELYAVELSHGPTALFCWVMCAGLT